MAAPPAGREPLWRRLAWFAALYGGSVLGLGVVSLLLRAWLRAG
ncbi:hypothetical protein OPKNFCMD_0025 [Methylobacterium crusticola]|uniref:DUF2474 domain-containing protein n=1 Tax=Methylobacterium crusticola TaxID=1697972 RepID=A0ABQ4QQL6_9HYPH|nr:DUF2474 family protein [Methylobacterium crusticola]GJD47319.1 hypothetical protein OPKNFCMD_0025 [Methylobacterium crusticola]